MDETEYSLLAETQRVGVHYGFIAFIKHFKYLGSWVSFSLHDDFYVKYQLTLTKYEMGDL